MGIGDTRLGGVTRDGKREHRSRVGVQGDWEGIHHSFKGMMLSPTMDGILRLERVGKRGGKEG